MPTVVRGLRKKAEKLDLRGDIVGAFIKNTAAWRSIFAKQPAGWGRWSRKQLRKVIEETDTYVQTLNDRYTNPSGRSLISVQHRDQAPAFGDADEPARESNVA